MNVVLDTNIIREDFLLKTENFRVLFDYLSKTNSKVILTEIVYKELEGVYLRELNERHTEYIKASEFLNRALVNFTVLSTKIEIQNQVQQYLEYVKNTLGISDQEIIRYKTTYLDDVVNRAIKRIPPCSLKGEEFRDVLLWLTIIDIAKGCDQSRLIFISNNTKQFGSDNGLLHPLLVEEAKTKGVSIKYYNSLKHFIKDHATQIEYLTTDWIKTAIDLKMINEKFIEMLENHGEDMLIEWAENHTDKELTGYVNPTIAQLDLDDFFVYEMEDGLIYLEISISGEVEVEYEIRLEQKSRDSKWEYNINPLSGDVDIEPVLKNSMLSSRNIEYKYFYPEFEVILSVEVKDKRVINYKIKEYDFL